MSPARPSPPAFAVLAFWAFTLGGLVFGGLFLGNWRALAQRPTATVALAGPLGGEHQISIGNLPRLSISVSQPKVELRPNPVTIVANLLPEWKGSERITILLLGIDKRDDQPVEGTRTDTIMLVSIDPAAKSVAMVSLPRDLWVSIPGYGSQRINTAHAFGGPDLARRTVTANFGIPVQYYVRVDFHGFQELINTLGGVLVDVERPVKDDAYPTDWYGYQRIYIAPGPQLMHGQAALYYARSRHADNDFGRARRQQQVLVAMRERALQLDMLPRAPQLVGLVQKAIGTDLSTTELLSLARLASEVDRDRIANLVVDGEFAEPFKGADGADLLRPDTPAIRRAIDAALRAAAHPELRARVEVLNGTDRRGLGSEVASRLEAQGFTVVRIAAADQTDYARSSIQVLTGNQQAGEALANALRLPPSAIRDEPNSRPSADIRIVIGQDLRLTPTAPGAGPPGSAPAGGGG